MWSEVVNPAPKSIINVRLFVDDDAGLVMSSASQSAEGEDYKMSKLNKVDVQFSSIVSSILLTEHCKIYYHCEGFSLITLPLSGASISQHYMVA